MAYTSSSCVPRAWFALAVFVAAKRVQLAQDLRDARELLQREEHLAQLQVGLEPQPVVSRLRQRLEGGLVKLLQELDVGDVPTASKMERITFSL